MHVLPAAVLALPEAGFFKPCGEGLAVGAVVLNQSNARDQGHLVAQQPDLR